MHKDFIPQNNNVTDSNKCEFDDREDKRFSSISAWEKADRARTFRESGFDGFSIKKGHTCFGTDIDSQINQSTLGTNESFTAELENRYPKIYYGGYVYNKSLNYPDDPGGRRLTSDQFVDFYNAVVYANSLGHAMSAHVIITWGLLGIHDHTEAANTLTDRLLKHFQSWCKYKMNGAQPVWIYVHENGRTHGFHTHLMFAIPNKLRKAFRSWLSQRLTEICRHNSMSKKAFEVVAPPSDRIVRQWKYFQYLMKSINTEEELVAHVGPLSHIPIKLLINRKTKNTGDVLCKKKCGVSNVIGKKARQTAGFLSLLDQGVTDVRRLYAGMEYLRYVRQKYSVLDEWNPVIVKLLKQEASVHKIVEQEILNQKENARLRKQCRKVRKELRLKEEEEAQLIAAYLARHKESWPDLSSLNL